MGKATIHIGTSSNPGPTIECNDSLEEIHRILEEEWAKPSSATGRPHFIASVVTPNFRLIFDRVAERDGKYVLRPAQR